MRGSDVTSRPQRWSLKSMLLYFKLTNIEHNNSARFSNIIQRINYISSWDCDSQSARTISLSSANKESGWWLTHLFFLNFVKLKFPYVVKKMPKPYDPLFRNTRENRVNTWEDIFSLSYSLFCAMFYKVWCGRAVIGVIFLVVTSVVRISIFFL